MTLATTRNLVIVLALAAVVDLVPGGGTAAAVVVQAISLTFLGALVWVVSIMYREHRNALYSLGERRRAIVYVALGVLALTLTATSRLWASSVGELVWVALVAASLYAGGSALWSLRRL